MTSKLDIFTPLVGAIGLSNRIVMAPMTRSRAIGNIPNDLMALYYKQRASAGLIVTEGTAPSPNALGYARIPGIYSQEQINGWKKVTDSVHSENGKIFLQLMHTGRVSHKANLSEEGTTLAPSAISADGDMWTDSLGMQKTDLPREMTREEIKTAITEFAQGAANAIEAGFDGVELHGANGYLIEQFLNPYSNRRTDEYGGSIENRSRFVIEVVKAVIEKIGSKKTGIRISPFNVFNGMPSYPETSDTYNYLVEELNKLKILYLHVVEASARKTEEGKSLIRNIREEFNGLLILNGGYNKETAEKALDNEHADLISFGAIFISNPDLPEKLQHNLALTAPDPKTFYAATESGYVDYN